jgi:hypothetical protein
MSKSEAMDMAVVVKERPIIFSGPMVKALLEDRKTQTRRVIRNPEKYSHIRDCGFCCPHGQPGEILWVRETWQDYCPMWHGYWCGHGTREGVEREHQPVYRADPESEWLRGPEGKQAPPLKWRSPLHMPRWAARIILEITEVRVQRLQEINEADARAEGFPIPGTQPCIVNGEPGEVTFFDPRAAFAYGWNAINGKRPGCAWIDNPWTWAITFKRLKP